MNDKKNLNFSDLLAEVSDDKSKSINDNSSKTFNSMVSSGNEDSGANISFGSLFSDLDDVKVSEDKDIKNDEASITPITDFKSKNDSIDDNKNSFFESDEVENSEESILKKEFLNAGFNTFRDKDDEKNDSLLDIDKSSSSFFGDVKDEYNIDDDINDNIDNNIDNDINDNVSESSESELGNLSNLDGKLLVSEDSKEASSFFDDIEEDNLDKNVVDNNKVTKKKKHKKNKKKLNSDIVVETSGVVGNNLVSEIAKVDSKIDNVNVGKKKKKNKNKKKHDDLLTDSVEVNNNNDKTNADSVSAIKKKKHKKDKKNKNIDKVVDDSSNISKVSKMRHKVRKVNDNLFLDVDMDNESKDRETTNDIFFEHSEIKEDDKGVNDNLFFESDDLEKNNKDEKIDIFSDKGVGGNFFFDSNKLDDEVVSNKNFSSNDNSNFGNMLDGSNIFGNVSANDSSYLKNDDNYEKIDAFNVPLNKTVSDSEEENKNIESSPMFADVDEIDDNNPFFSNSLDLDQSVKHEVNDGKLDVSNTKHFDVKIVKKKEPLLKFIMGVISYALFIWLLLIGITLLIYVADIKIRALKGDYSSPKYNAYVVLTGSMLPDIQVYDVVITKKVPVEKLKEDDIITFASSDTRFAGTIITHRIINVYHDASTDAYTFQTRGDNNNVADSALVQSADIYGKVIFKIPKLGYLQKFLARQGGWIIVILIPCLLVISYDIVKLFRSVKGRKYKKLKVTK